jgi:hypothetical protein
MSGIDVNFNVCGLETTICSLASVRAGTVRAAAAASMMSSPLVRFDNMVMRVPLPFVDVGSAARTSRHRTRRIRACLSRGTVPDSSSTTDAQPLVLQGFWNVARRDGLFGACEGR